nr:BPSL0761 family protein [Collimonas sp. OK307]
MPHERTRSVVQAREFLQELARSADVPESVRTEARRLLRHYPSDGDLHLTALALPGWWEKPTEERTTSNAFLRQSIN